ncbi:MAG: hypothetical protein GY835_22970, partial [bacterium]|nr:hypothetical protein [bacterium]
SFRLGPFATPDGNGFVSPAGQELEFTTSEGIIVTVPEAAFDQATLVTVTTLDPANVGVEPPGMVLGGFLQIDFAGQAAEPLSLRVPVADDARVGAQVFIGEPKDYFWGRMLRLLSVGEIVDEHGQRYMSNHPAVQPEPIRGEDKILDDGDDCREQELCPCTEPNCSGCRPCMTCQEIKEGGLSECWIREVLLELSSGTSAAFFHEATAEWSLYAGHGPGQDAVVMYASMDQGWAYEPDPRDWDGQFAIPVPVGEEFQIIQVDLATGWISSEQDYDPIPYDGGPIEYNPDYAGDSSIQDNNPPMIVDASPFSVIRFGEPPRDVKQRLRLEIEVSLGYGDFVELGSVEDSPLPDETRLGVYEIAGTLPLGAQQRESPREVLSPEGGNSLICSDRAWQHDISKSTDEPHGDFLLFVHPGGLEADNIGTFEFQFDRRLTDLSEENPRNVAKLYDLGPADGCGQASSTVAGGDTLRELPISLLEPGYDSDDDQAVERQEKRYEGGRLVIWPVGSLPAGHRFKLQLMASKITVEKASGSTGPSYAALGGGPTKFYFATRAVPGDPIGEMPDANPLGDTGQARDMVGVGNLLMVASATGKLLAVDINDTRETPNLKEPLEFGLHAIKNGYEDQITTLQADSHNRIYYTALLGNQWVARTIRLEDVRRASSTCAFQPEWANDLGCFSSVAGRVHIGYGLNATSGIGFSEWGAYSAAMALGYPVDLDVVVLDEESDTLELAEFYKEFGGDDFGVDSCDDYTNGICEFDIELSSSVARDSVTTWREDWCDGERAWYHYQRVTVDNLTTGQSWSIDIENQWGEQDGGNIGRGTVENIRARRGD